VFFFLLLSKPQYGYAGLHLNTVHWPALEYQNMGMFAHAWILKHGYICPHLDIKTQVYSPMLGYQNMGTFE
jgi:hypothetical protein